MPEISDRDRLFPELNEAQIARLAQRGKRRAVKRGEELWRVGAPKMNFYVVLSGTIEVVRPLPGGEESLTVHGPRQFTGDVDLIFGSRAVVAARAGADGEVLELTRESLLDVVQTDAELSDLILLTFLQRRAFLIAHSKGDAVLVGSRHSADTLRLREFLMRNARPCTYLDVEKDQGVQDLLQRFHVRPEDLPVLIVGGEAILRRPSNAEVAEQLGLTVALEESKIYDVIIAGAGPAGLAAAVHAASEGLQVLVLEMHAPGGQAGTSSRIENYFGFPAGITGQELTARGFTQANKFGARFAVARSGVGLDRGEGTYSIALDGGGSVQARAVIIACGVRYRAAGIPGVERFEGTCVHHAATNIEAQLCAGEEVAIVGGGNSAGQAAVYLARVVRHVHVLVRGPSLAESMSRYLVRVLEELPNVTIHTRTRIVRLEGEAPHLKRVTWRDEETGKEETHHIQHVFLMIGADPNTGWLEGALTLDEKGFIKTGIDVGSEERSEARWPLGREPYTLETVLPAVFAVGDVRSGSVKRIAAAAGEGASSVQLLFRALQDS